MSVFVRLASIILLYSALVCEAAETAGGRWEGSIQIPGSEFPLIVDLDQVAGKTWAGSVIIPGLGVKGAPLTDLSVGDSEISFTIKAALASERTGPGKIQRTRDQRGAIDRRFSAGRQYGALRVAKDWAASGGVAAQEYRHQSGTRGRMERRL